MQDFYHVELGFGVSLGVLGLGLKGYGFGLGV